MDNQEKKDVLYHKSVLVNEVLTYLNPKPGGVYLDATFGTGGHTRAILEREPSCRVIALDWDALAVDKYGGPMMEEFGDRLTVVWGSFAHLYRIAKKQDIKQIDGILADFGTSQVQIGERSGFSVYRDTPLDMRMSVQHQKVTAAEIVNSGSRERLCAIFWQLGEELQARQIVEAILLARSKKDIRTTGELADIVATAIHKNPKHARSRSIHPATKVFQALRMFVNHELENIEAFLPAAVGTVAAGGRIVCISFHSLEDRIVKQYFATNAHLSVITKRVVIPTPEEVAQNNASRSARLRCAQKID